VTAEPLSKIPGNTQGSPPGENPPGWDLIQSFDRDSKEEKLKRWSTRNMRRLHLLSEKLHGPGVAWNLVPGQGTANSEMEREIESDAKERVAADEVMFYRVKVDFYPAPIENFPSAVHATWGGLKEEKPGEWKPTGDAKSHTVSPEKPPFDGSSTQARLSTLSRDALMEKELPFQLALQIRSEAINGPFTDVQDFKKRMRARYGSAVNFDDDQHWGVVSRSMARFNMTF
jgi:hypothetical protein